MGQNSSIELLHVYKHILLFLLHKSTENLPKVQMNRYRLSTPLLLNVLTHIHFF